MDTLQSSFEIYNTPLFIMILETYAEVRNQFTVFANSQIIFITVKKLFHLVAVWSRWHANASLLLQLNLEDVF
jgi:hypothetical protein